MKVILKKDVQSLGETGDVLVVADGFGRNYLLPQGFAEIATKGSLENRERNINRIKAKAEKMHQHAMGEAAIIEAVGTIEIPAKAGENGKLYGAITTRKLAEEIKDRSGIEVDRRNITLNAPINHLGEYTLVAKLTSKVEVKLTVMVVASELIKD